MPLENNHLEYEKLLQIFNSIYPLSDELRNAIVENSDIVHVKRKTKLLSAGDRSNAIYFIVKGAARVYYLNNQGIETTTWLLLENELLISVYSFFTAQPSFEYIEAIEDCTLVSLKREMLDKLYRDFIEFNFIGRKLTEQYYIRNEVQANNLRILNARQRYDQLMVSNPELISRVSLGYIASYLGITQATLSRVRKQK